MPRNCVQHQKGLSDDAFELRYPDEEACRKTWFAWRWPEGFNPDHSAGWGRAPRCKPVGATSNLDRRVADVTENHASASPVTRPNDTPLNDPG